MQRPRMDEYFPRTTPVEPATTFNYGTSPSHKVSILILLQHRTDNDSAFEDTATSPMAGPSTHDAGYLAFVQLLQEKNDILSIIELPKISGSTVHYLSTLPLEYVPTFANAIATSPSLWLNASSREEVCMSLQAAFRVAAAGRLQDTETSGGGSRKKTLNSWTSKVLEGVTAQHLEPDISLALLTGLLQGIQDLRDIKSGTAKLRLEIEVSALCAELLDSLPSDGEVSGDWTVEYRSAIAQPSSGMNYCA